MNDHQRRDLWDEINRYAAACGGDTSADTATPLRQAAVARIESIVREIEAEWANGYRDVLDAMEVRCSRCGCVAVDHEVDDEERRGCTACECTQYEATQ